MTSQLASIAFVILWGMCQLTCHSRAADFDLVINHGRVIDPHSGLDAVRSLGISGATIAAISTTPLVGKETIDAKGLVVSPGFIDLHQHSWDDESIRLKALDGVTSILELEVGTAEVDRWYREREGKTRIHFGVSIGHIPVRMAVLGDPPAFLPPAGAMAINEVATGEQIAAMSARITQGINEGAVAVGFGLAYTPAASDEELLAMFGVAARHHASCHLHMRSRTTVDDGPRVVMDTARLAAQADAALHFVHFQAGAREQMPELLRLVDAWRDAGQDVTTEAYPWTAGMTEIKSAIFSEGFQQRLGITYQDVQWGATGERLTEESFHRYQDDVGGLVIVHNNTEAAVRLAMKDPTVMIASDGLRGHPRNAGTYARLLGHYVREQGDLDLMTAIAKTSLLPAQRLERLTTSMRRKGRVQVGCDADLTLFDPLRVDAQATYESPFLPSQGIHWVLIDGTPVVRQGKLVADVFPGRAIRSTNQ